jgi:DNA-binding CsgD family transcriptional regulator/PAS domain-containing protein
MGKQTRSRSLVSSAHAELVEIVRRSPIALFLIRLSDSQFVEVSDPVVAFTGRTRTELLTTKLADYVGEPALLHEYFDHLARGRLDSYARHGTYRRPGGEDATVDVRFSAFPDEGPRETAVGLLLSDAAEAAVVQVAEPVEEVFVLGTVDHLWQIDRITSDVADLLAYQPEEVLGRSALAAVHSEDLATLLLLVASSRDRAGGACGRLRLRSREERWVLCRVVVVPLAGKPSGAFAFTLSPVKPGMEPTRERTLELERHLGRIAREVAASGVGILSSAIPTSKELPVLSSLSSREYEIVIRLASGQRVATIARALFLSESTVRNHLTGAYRKLGVHSQTALLDMLHARRSS